MSFHQKILFLSFCFLLPAAVAGASFCYQKIHPKYIPPAPREEVDLTIIPGWNLRKVADYLVEQKLASGRDDVYKLIGEPADDYRRGAFVLPKAGDYKILADKPDYISYEGYLAPETYRVFKDASLKEVIGKLIRQREKQITGQMRADIKKSGKSFFEILTMASIVEKEAPASEMPVIADIFWRRYDKNWALQSCATVNYITGKNDPAVSPEDKKIDSLYNTYKYPGLPLGPISNPGVSAIKAVVYPVKNDYWYFLSDKEGVIHYAKTLEEQNANKAKYLR